MHAYLVTMFIVQVIGVLGQIGTMASPKRNGLTLLCLLANMGFMVWSAVLLWS